MKEKTPFVTTIFEKMKKKAETLLQNTEKGKYTQAIVLYTTSDKEYSRVIRNALTAEKTDEAALLEQLKSTNDTEVLYVFCMWQYSGLDITSYDFRKMLLSMDSQNAESLMFLMTADGVCVKKLSVTMI